MRNPAHGPHRLLWLTGFYILLFLPLYGPVPLVTGYGLYLHFLRLWKKKKD